jgi:hypothetical protein
MKGAYKKKPEQLKAAPADENSGINQLPPDEPEPDPVDPPWTPVITTVGCWVFAVVEVVVVVAVAPVPVPVVLPVDASAPLFTAASTVPPDWIVWVTAVAVVAAA